MTAPLEGARPRRPGRGRGLLDLAIWLVSAAAVVGAVALFGAILMTSNLLGGIGVGPTAAPSASEAPPTPWLRSIAPGQLGMPPGSDCGACHVTVDGQVGVRPIPALGHPVHGWTTCTECHTGERLVQTAPGHTGIHADQCLVCHTDAAGPAPTPQHPSLAGSDCLGCHGRIAPLPSSMVDRPAELCWLCHQSR